mgnify:CR=1 FL=1
MVRFRSARSTLAAVLALSCPAAIAHAQATPAPAAAPGVTATIDNAGAEPRRELRYTPAPGDTQRFAFTVHNTIRRETADKAMPEMVWPAMTVTTRSTITDTSAGRIAADMTFDSFDIGEGPDANLAVALSEMLRPAIGVGGSMKFSDRGDDLGFTLSADAQALGPGAALVTAIANSLRGVIAMTPAEAVGAGAQWTTVESRPDDQGVLIVQKIRHTVRSLDGNRYAIDLVLEQTAEPQDLPAQPTMPGATMRLESLKGQGTATVEGTFGALLPDAVTLNLNTTTVITYRQNDADQTLIRTNITQAEGKTLPVSE